MTVVWVVLGCAAAFLVGAASPATLVARALGADLARSGSGNPGATNAGRVLGRKWGVLVGVLDVLKGALPPIVAGLLGQPTWVGYLVGAAAVLGHVFSPFLRGRGGKGVATTLGAVLAVHPWYAAALVVVFGLVFAATRWVALGSLCAAAVLAIVGVLAAAGVVPGGVGWATGAWAVGLGLLVGWRHRTNVVARWRASRARRR